MTPADLQPLFDAALGRAVANVWLLSLLALICSAVGAFAGSYLRKRGEDKATTENFAAIRSHLQATTRDTEEIKQQLAGHAWKSQRQWTARENYYSQLLTNLHQFKMALDNLSDYYIEPGSEHIPDSQRDKHFRKLLASSATSYREVEKLLGPAAIFLSPGAVAALNELFVKHWELATFGAICTADYIQSAHELAIAIYDRVLLEAKRDLGLAGSDA